MFSKKPEVALEPPPHKHMWEKWEKQRVTGMVAIGSEFFFPVNASTIYQTPMQATKYTERQVDIQERRCTICGFYERQVLGYL